MKEQEPWSEAEKRFRLRTALVAMARDGLAIQARRQAAEEAVVRAEAAATSVQQDEEWARQKNLLWPPEDDEETAPRAIDDGLIVEGDTNA